MKKIITMSIISSLLAASSVSTYAIYDINNPSSASDGGYEMMIMNTSLAPIMYQVYDTQEDFERSEGHICESATDGVNTFMMKDGVAAASTRMGYPEDFTATWKCNSYISDKIIGWSQSDKNEYNTLIDRVSDSENKKIESVIKKFNAFIAQYPTSQKTMITESFLELIDTKVGDIIMNNPQDVALPDDVTSIYSMLRLLRYEIVVQN